MLSLHLVLVDVSYLPAALDIRSIVSILHGLTIVISTAFLSRIVRAVLGWIFPGKITLKSVVPISGKWILCLCFVSMPLCESSKSILVKIRYVKTYLWSTKQWSRSTIPHCSCGCCQFHIWVHFTLHMFHSFRTDIVLVTLF